MTTYITTAKFESANGGATHVQWENEYSVKWTALMQKAKEIGAARFDLAGATHVEKPESPRSSATDPRLAQALAILDALDRLVTQTQALHLAKDSHGRYVVRYDNKDELLSSERHAGMSARDALAQLVQSHPEES